MSESKGAERGVKERRNVCFCHSQGERERELCDRNFRKIEVLSLREK